MQAVTGNGIVDIHSGVHDSIACRCNRLDRTTLQYVMRYALVTDLQILNMLRITDPVKIQHTSQRLIVGVREEDLTIAGRTGYILGMGSLGVIKRINRDIACIFAYVSLQVYINAVLTVTERIIPVMCESAHIACLHHIVFRCIATAV